MDSLALCGLWAKIGQNEQDIKKLKIIINNNFTNFIFCKINSFEILIVFSFKLKRLYKINYYSYIYKILFNFKLFFILILFNFVKKNY